jgi:hypothetical protein
MLDATTVSAEQKYRVTRVRPNTRRQWRWRPANTEFSFERYRYVDRSLDLKRRFAREGYVDRSLDLKRRFAREGEDHHVRRARQLGQGSSLVASTPSRGRCRQSEPAPEVGPLYYRGSDAERAVSRERQTLVGSEIERCPPRLRLIVAALASVRLLAWSLEPGGGR